MDKPSLWVKRWIDIVVALAILILCAPVMLAVSLAIYIVLGSPIIFRQQRPGLYGLPFEVYKFRTMSEAKSVNGVSLSNAERTGRVGKLLRKLSLDELPQIFNVLKGEMSLVGPRPLLMEYLELYTPSQRRRHEMKPGITGLAQVSGRNNLPWNERFDLDVWYVDNWSLWLDLRIILMTVRKVISGEGVAVPELTKFQGDGSLVQQETED